MTFSSMVMYAYIGFLFLGAGLGVLSIFNAGGWFIIYIAQLVGYGFGAYQLFMFQRIYNESRSGNAKAKRSGEDEENEISVT